MNLELRPQYKAGEARALREEDQGKVPRWTPDLHNWTLPTAAACLDTGLSLREGLVANLR